MKPIIAIDCDGVLADFATPFFAWHNKNYGTNFTPEDNLDEDLTKLYNLPLAEILSRAHKFFDEELHSMNPLPGSKEALAELSKKHRFILVTSRSERLLAPTAKWLETHYPGLFESVMHCHGTTKVAMCKEHGVIAMLEDQANFIREFEGSGIKVIMFDQPWNRYYEFSPRVKNWQEALEHFR